MHFITRLELCDLDADVVGPSRRLAELPLSSFREASQDAMPLQPGVAEIDRAFVERFGDAAATVSENRPCPER